MMKFKITVRDVYGQWPPEASVMEFSSEEELFTWVKNEYTNVARPWCVPEPVIGKPFKGWDGDDSEFGPYEILIEPVEG
ncbi:MAG: hypothetical protein GXO39_04355 [Thermotogae bacterium]|nr:hypothetical protein [Thermotogota bacterium]